MKKLYQIIKSRVIVKGTAVTLEKWLEANGISLKDFEIMSGVPYQRISEHIRLNKPLSEKHILMILKATDCKVSPETLRPSLNPIFQLLNNRRRVFLQKMIGFAVGLAMVLGVFAFVIFQGPTDFSESVIAQNQQHYEEARKAVTDGNLELAMSHLEAIEKKTPAWYESRELYWQIKTELNTYARKEKD
jgi:hypothetical protein